MSTENYPYKKIRYTVLTGGEVEVPIDIDDKEIEAYVKEELWFGTDKIKEIKWEDVEDGKN